MNREALLLTLSAALLHATWNFAAKRAEGGGPVVRLGLRRGVVGLIWVPVTAGLVALAPAAPELDLARAPASSAGCCTSPTADLLQTGYAAGDMNLVYPLARGTGPLLTVLVAVLVFREPTDVLADGRAWPWSWPACWSSRSGRPAAPSQPASSPARHPVRRRRPAPASRRTRCGTPTPSPRSAIPPLPYFTLGLLCQSARPDARARCGRRRADAPAAAAPAPAARSWSSPLCRPWPTSSCSRRSRSAPVSVVAPVRESSIVVGALLSWLVLREPHPARRLAGSVVVLAGVAALALE